METLRRLKAKITFCQKTDKIFLVLFIIIFFEIILATPIIRKMFVSLLSIILNKNLYSEELMNRIFYWDLKLIIFNIIVLLLYCFFTNFISYSKVFFVSILLCFLHSNLMIVLNGNFVGYYMYWDFGDLINYFPHFVNGGLYESEYPPMAVLLYKLYNLFLPIHGQDVSSAINYDITFFFFTTAIPIFYLLLRSFYGNNKRKFYLSIIFFLTGPMLYAFERGNLILYALIFTLAFLYFYKSDNPVYREMSFLFLAIAANLKLYPAVFGAVLLKEKRWKEAIRTFLYGVVVFILPSFFTDKGIMSILDFIKSCGKFSDESVWFAGGLSIREWLVRVFFKSRFDSLHQISFLLNVIMIVVFFVCLFLFFTSKKKWQGYLMLTYMCILIPAPAYYYNMIFMIIPFIEFLNAYSGSFAEKITAILFIPIFLYDYGYFLCQPNTIWHIYFLFVLMVVFVIWDYFKGKGKQISQQY